VISLKIFAKAQRQEAVMLANRIRTNELDAQSMPENPLLGALAGIRVVDFTQVAAGPLCTMMLADLGADVVKIEPPGGELGRMLGPPFVNGESTAFLALNRNKRSIVLDLKTQEGRQHAHGLIAEADVLVESFRPGVADRLGIGFSAMRARFPRLVYCSISAYGQSGPLSAKPGVDGVLQAASGLMSITGREGEPPSKLQAPVVDMVTGYHAVIAVLAGLSRRAAATVPGHLDVNMFASALMLQQVPLAAYLNTGELPARTGSGAPYATPNEAYRTADGYILVAAYQESRWRRFCALIARPDLIDDPRFAAMPIRMQHRAELTLEIERALAKRTTAEWVERLEGGDIICAPIADYATVNASPHVAASAVITRLRHPTAGDVSVPGFAIGGGAIPCRLPPPLLDEHHRNQ
jgi:crotonobetainyl-CoA:carnitine CoA-transferase CaiB-like acyl-CoA transferase